MKTGLHRNRIGVALGLLAIAVIGLLLLLTRRNAEPLAKATDRSDELSDSSQQDANSSSNSQPDTLRGNLTSLTTNVFGNNAPLAPAEALPMLNDVPIVYYGQVRDQFQNALPGTPVDFNVQYYTGSASGVTNGQTITDGNGRFEISGYRGERLSVKPRREGYIFIGTNGGGIYSHMWPKDKRHTPDPANPEVLTMWKLQGAEPLVAFDAKFRFPYDAKPIRFDLTTGRIVASEGDFKISIVRPSGTLSKQRPLNWQLVAEAVNGGLMEVENTVYRTTLQAPDGGYSGRIEVNMDADNPAWFDTVRKQLFVKSRDGQVYSKLYFSLRLNEKPDDLITVSIRGLANIGSRNWEEDPAKIKSVP